MDFGRTCRDRIRCPGRIPSVTDGTGSKTHGYDEVSRITSETTTYVGLAGRTVSYQFSPDGSTKKILTDIGNLHYLYDAAGRWTDMESPAGTVHAAYYSNNWQSSRTLPNGVKSTYTYTDTGLLSSLLHQSAGGSTLGAFTSFSYDGVFNLTGFTASVPSASVNSSAVLTYDGRQRLTNETGFAAGNDSYVYDLNSNSTSFRGFSRTYNASNQLTMSGFAYDLNGNPTT